MYYLWSRSRSVLMVGIVALIFTPTFQDYGVAQVNHQGAPAGVSYFEWSQYQNDPIVMMPVSEGFCFLQAVAGKFQGSGEAVWIRKDATRRYWVLDGKSSQEDVAASARCVPLGAIQGADQGVWISDIATAEADARNSKYDWGSASTPLWISDSFCYLTGMSGKFMGSGEHVYLLPYDPSLPETPHYVSVLTLQTYIRAEAGCIALPGRARLNTTLTQALDRGGLLIYHWEQGDAPEPLPNANLAFCGLWGIRGKFQGSGEVVGIYADDDGNQILAGGSKQKGVAADAVCFYYDQRQ